MNQKYIPILLILQPANLQFKSIVSKLVDTILKIALIITSIKTF